MFIFYILIIVFIPKALRIKENVHQKVNFVSFIHISSHKFVPDSDDDGDGGDDDGLRLHPNRNFDAMDAAQLADVVPVIRNFRVELGLLSSEFSQFVVDDKRIAAEKRQPVFSVSMSQHFV